MGFLQKKNSFNKRKLRTVYRGFFCMGKNMVEKYVEDEIILENVRKRIVDEKFKQKLLKIVENNKEKYPLVDAYENDSCNPSSVGLELAWLNTIADDIRAIKNMMVDSRDRRE